MILPTHHAWNQPLRKATPRRHRCRRSNCARLRHQADGFAAALANGTCDAQNGLSMIRANCRERFTASDFDFVVRTLARSQTDCVSLVDLLSDQETRDAVLDNSRLVDSILSNAGHLAISSQFYFYVLARHVLQRAGINDRKLCDYVASLLETFSRISGMSAPGLAEEQGRQYISDMLFALTRATPEQAFLLRAHVGNYSLFISGIFHENAERRHLRGGGLWRQSLQRARQADRHLQQNLTELDA